MGNTFSETGFAIIRNAIDPKTINNIHNNIYYALDNKETKSIENNDLYQVFFDRLKNNKNTLYEFTLPIFEYLLYRNSFEELLKSKKIFMFLTDFNVSTVFNWLEKQLRMF